MGDEPWKDTWYPVPRRQQCNLITGCNNPEFNTHLLTLLHATQDYTLITKLHVLSGLSLTPLAILSILDSKILSTQDYLQATRNWCHGKYIFRHRKSDKDMVLTTCIRLYLFRFPYLYFIFARTPSNGSSSSSDIWSES